MVKFVLHIEMIKAILIMFVTIPFPLEVSSVNSDRVCMTADC